MANIAALPAEIQAKCLAPLLWSDSARAACVNRLWRQLVRNVDRQPVWISDLWEHEPEDVGDWESGTPDFSSYVEDNLDALRFAGRPDVCFITTTAQWGDYLSQLASAFRKVLPACTAIVGCCGTGVIGTPQNGVAKELEDAVGVSVVLMHLPPSVKCEAFQFGGRPRKSLDLDATLTQLAGDYPEAGNSSPPPVVPRPLFLVMMDNPDVGEYWMRRLQHRFPGSILAGGVASHAAPLVLTPGRHSAQDPIIGSSNSFSRVVGLALWGEGVRCCPVVVRGMRVVSTMYRVVEVSAGVKKRRLKHVSTLVTKLQEMQLDDEAGDGVKLSAAGPVFDVPDWLQPFLAGEHAMEYGPFNSEEVGVACHQDAGEGSLKWDVRSFGMEAGGLAVEGEVEVGDIIAGVTLEAQQGAFDLRRCLSQKKAEMLEGCMGASAGVAGGEARGVCGVLAAVCCGRGQGVYQEPHVEARIFKEVLPGVPISGFFAMGEIGPSPMNEAGCDDYTTSHNLAYSSVYLGLKLLPPANTH